MHANKGIDPTRILGKGPDYFRRQLDREREAKAQQRPSAVERLAASKPQYVRSQPPGHKPQQVVDRSPRAKEQTHEPVVSLGYPSGSSDGSSKGSSNARLRDGACQSAQPLQELSPAARRRSAFKKQRPDSLLIYRHKQEHVKGAPNEGSRGNPVRRLLVSSLKERMATEKHCAPKDSGDTCVANRSRKAEPGPSGASKASAEPELRLRRGVVRSHSDISSRYSRNVADFETFFTYCGLDSDVVEALGRENFSARSDELELRVRSASTSTSADGFSRRSGCSDGLHEDELGEGARHNTSVVERNARVIKWLYSCRNADEAGKALRELH